MSNWILSMGFSATNSNGQILVGEIQQGIIQWVHGIEWAEFMSDFVTNFPK